MRNEPLSYESCFDEHEDATFHSARRVVPLLLDVVNPKSVIDFGCGRGIWLRTFQDNGVRDIQGIDSPLTDTSKLWIDIEHFRAIDINQRFDVPRTYDLAICLEVAEHIPPVAGKNLIRTMTLSSPVVLFSAAIPGQTGVGHINEQWPSYWQKLFAGFSFKRMDVIRPQIFQNNDVSWWYRQNLYLFAREDVLTGAGPLGTIFQSYGKTELDIVHSTILRRYSTFRGLLGEIAPAALRALRHRLS